MRPLIVDALASGQGKRMATRDIIGAGPRAVAGVMERRGIKPRIALAESILDGDVNISRHDALLASGMSSDLGAIRRIVLRWRSRAEGPALIGGPVASDPERAILKAGADLCVIGEGESTLEELLDLGLEEGRLPDTEGLLNIRGIAYLDGGVVRVNPLRPMMRREVYDGLKPSTDAVMDYSLFRSARVYVEVLRGCSNYRRAMISLPSGSCAGCGRCLKGGLEERYDCPRGVPPGCGYCSVPSLFGPPKSRSMDGIVEEIGGLLSKGVRRIVLSAPDFLDYGRDLLVEPEPLTDPERPEPNYSALEGLLSRLAGLDSVLEGRASMMVENVKPCLVTPQAADILGHYLAGTPVNIGLETGSAEHALQLGRTSSPEVSIQAVERLGRAGLKPYVYFIHGLPGQTSETVEETVDCIRRSVEAGASRIILYRFRPLPMSAFRDQPIAPPAAKDRLSKRIYDAAREANMRLKEDLRGEKLRVVIAEPFERDKRYHVAYPMLHGPVVLVDGAAGLDGEVVDVEVVGVVSDRIVRGRLRDGTF